MARGVFLEALTWVEAEGFLGPEAIVVLPIGAAAKEHGRHLPLNNDLTIATYLARRVAEAADVVIAPAVNYHFYPAFVEYPGSTSLRLGTARDLVIDIVSSLAAFGPRRFYGLNTGLSTVRALAPAAATLAEKGILFAYSENRRLIGDVEKRVAEQEGGTHADELETSMMLYMAPESVDMTKAAKDYDPDGKGGFSRVKGNGKTYSPSGVFGDPTLATLEKGRTIVEALVQGLLDEIQALRSAPVPAAVSSEAPSRPR